MIVVEPVSLIVNHDAVWLIEIVDVNVPLRVCVLVLISVEVDVLDAKLEELFVTIILLETIGVIEWDGDAVVVFVIDSDPEIVVVVLILLEFKIVLLPLLETVDVLVVDEDPENFVELLDVFEFIGVKEFVEDLVDVIVCVTFGVFVFITVIVSWLVNVTRIV